MDPNQLLLPRLQPHPLLLSADLPPRNPPSRARPARPGAAIAAQLYRLRRFLIKEIIKFLEDPKNTKKLWWDAWNSERGEQRVWGRPRLLLPSGFRGMDVRGFIRRVVARISYSQLVMLASVAAGMLLFYCAAGRRDGAVEEDRRLLPLEVRRCLRVMAMRLVPPRPPPLPRWPLLEMGLRAPPMSRWPRGEGGAVAPVGAGNRHAVAGPARVGAALTVDRVSFTEPVGAQVYDAAEGRGCLLVAPIGAHVVRVYPPLHLAASVAESGQATSTGPHGDFKEIVSMLRHIKDNAHKDGLKKTEQAICSCSVATEIQSMVQDTKTKFEKKSYTTEIQSMVQDTQTKFEKERQNSLKAITPTSKECETSFKTKYTKFEVTNDKFCKDKTAHLQNCKDLFLKREVEKEKVIVQYELQRKEGKATLSELENITVDKLSVKRMKQLQHCLGASHKSGEKGELAVPGPENIADAEVSLKKMKPQGKKSMSMLRKSVTSFQARPW